MAEFAEFIDGDRGKNYPTYNDFSVNGYCLFLNASNVTESGFDFTTCMFITEDKDKAMNKGRLSLFDIVLTSRGTIGNVALFDTLTPFKNIRINSGMLILRPKSNCLSPYVLYALLKSSLMKNAVVQFQTGSAQPQLPIKDLQKIMFKIPVLEKDINVLGYYLKRIEEHISINKLEIRILENLAGTLLSVLSR